MTKQNEQFSYWPRTYRDLPKADKLEAITATVWTMLRDEAERVLESIGTDWYGAGIGEHELTEATRRALLGIKVARRQNRLERRCCSDPERLAELRARARELRQQRDEHEAALDVLGLWMEAHVKAHREACFERLVQVLWNRYHELSRVMPLEFTTGSLPDDLREWLQLQERKGMLKHPVARMLAYLVVRDCEEHKQNFDVLPVNAPTTHMLTDRPMSKAEERMERLLAKQFCHENGDRRTNDGGHASEAVTGKKATKDMNGDRVAVQPDKPLRQRVGGTAWDDPAEQSEYNGLAALPALYVPEYPVCRACAGAVKDDVLVAREGDEKIGVFYGHYCDCSETRVSPVFEDRKLLRRWIAEQMKARAKRVAAHKVADVAVQEPLRPVVLGKRRAASRAWQATVLWKKEEPVAPVPATV